MYVDCGVLEKSVIIKSVLILNNRNFIAKAQVFNNIISLK